MVFLFGQVDTEGGTLASRHASYLSILPSWQQRHSTNPTPPKKELRVSDFGYVAYSAGSMRVLRLLRFREAEL